MGWVTVLICGLLASLGIGWLVLAQPTEYIVTYPGFSYAELQAKCNLLNCTQIFTDVIQGIVITTDPASVATLSIDDPNIGSFTANSQVAIQSATVASQRYLSNIFQEAAYSSYWAQEDAPAHLDRIDQVSLPLNGKYVPWNNCTGVDIYVVDTGVRATHVEFLDAGGSVRIGAGYTSPGIDGNATTDCDGHVSLRTLRCSRSFGP